jgi:hypothetical protein
MKINFRTQLRLEYSGNGSWKSLAPFVVDIDDETYIVPPDTVSDLDSVPRIPMAYWLAKNRAIQSSFLHDYLYTIKKPRAWADKVMLEAMKVEGVNAFMRRLIWAGVRGFGWSAYDKKNDATEVP